MAIWYVKKYNQKIGWVRKIFNPINITSIDNKYIVELPDESYAKKFAKKIYEKDEQNLVIASNLNEEPFRKFFNILDGRKIFKYLLPEILEYITKLSEVELQKLEIAIITNDNSENNCKLICEIADKVKTVNVITNDIDKFKKLEEYLMSNMGIVIHLANNKKKALLKSSIIFNLDLNEKELNQYAMPKSAVIINVKGKIFIKSRKFEGINCNYYSIVLPKKYEEWLEKNNLMNLYDADILLESMMFYKKTYDAIREKIQNIKIECLIGNNGRIEDNEFSKINFNKLLDKSKIIN